MNHMLIPFRNPYSTLRRIKIRRGAGSRNQPRLIPAKNYADI